MGTHRWKDIKGRAPGKQAANGRAVLRKSTADKGEAERLAALPSWAVTRIAELTTEVERLEAAVGRIRQASRELDELVVAADDGDDIGDQE